MSALSEIHGEIERTLRLAEREAGQPIAPAVQRFARAHRMEVHVGKSAELSIIAVTGDGKLPETIDDVPVVRTEAFDGYALVIK